MDVRRRRFHVRPLFAVRGQFGAWAAIVPLMMAEDPQKFFNYLRMTPALFNELLAQVGPALQRREVPGHLCPGQRLSLTLR